MIELKSQAFLALDNDLTFFAFFGVFNVFNGSQLFANDDGKEQSNFGVVVGHELETFFNFELFVVFLDFDVFVNIGASVLSSFVSVPEVKPPSYLTEVEVVSSFVVPVPIPKSVLILVSESVSFITGSYSVSVGSLLEV